MMRVERSVLLKRKNEWLNACYISYFQQKDFRVFRVFRVVSSKSGIENIFLFS